MNYFKNAINYLLSLGNLKLVRVNPNAKINPKKVWDISDNLDNEIFFIFQMGKVASSTIERSLKDKGFAVVRAHCLTEVTLSQLEYTLDKDYIPPNFLEATLTETRKNKLLRNELYKIHHKNMNNIKIITLTREPIAYLVSAYFQNLMSFYSYYIEKKYDKLDLVTIKNHFLNCIQIYLKIFAGKTNLNENDYKDFWKEYTDADVRHFLFYCRWPLIWFDREMKGFFNFDIYTRHYDKNSGISTYQDKEMSVLILKFEKFGEVGKDQIGKYVNDLSFELINRNVSKDKEYFDLYSDFLSSIVLPKEFVDYQYSSKYAQFFYSKEELDEFSYRWQSKNA